MNVPLNRLLSKNKGKVINITTTAINEGSAWATHGTIIDFDDNGVLLEEDMNSPYDKADDEKKTRLAYFPLANIACISERDY